MTSLRRVCWYRVRRARIVGRGACLLRQRAAAVSARQSAAVDFALQLIGKPRKDGGRHTAYSAALAAGLALSTIYRALARQRKTKRR